MSDINGYAGGICGERKFFAACGLVIAKKHYFRENACFLRKIRQKKKIFREEMWENGAQSFGKVFFVCIPIFQKDWTKFLIFCKYLAKEMAFWKIFQIMSLMEKHMYYFHKKILIFDEDFMNILLTL